MHDAYRVDKGGKPTFDRVMKGLEVLKRHQVDWSVLTTVHAVNGNHGREVYRFLRDELSARFIQYIPIIERATERTLPAADTGWGGRVKGRPLYLQEGNLVTHRSVGPGQYGRVPDQGSRGPVHRLLRRRIHSRGRQDSYQPTAGAQSERDLREVSGLEDVDLQTRGRQARGRVAGQLRRIRALTVR